MARQTDGGFSGPFCERRAGRSQNRSAICERWPRRSQKREGDGMQAGTAGIPCGKMGWPRGESAGGAQHAHGLHGRGFFNPDEAADKRRPPNAFRESGFILLKRSAPAFSRASFFANRSPIFLTGPRNAPSIWLAFEWIIPDHLPRFTKQMVEMPQSNSRKPFLEASSLFLQHEVHDAGTL